MGQGRRSATSGTVTEATRGSVRRAGSPGTGETGVVVLITQRSQVQILPPLPILQVIPEGADPCQGVGSGSFCGFGAVSGHAGIRSIVVMGWAWCGLLLPVAAISGERAGRSRTGRSPACAARAVGVLEAPGRDPIMGRREPGGYVVVFRPRVQPCLGRRLAAVIPSGFPRLPAAGAWGGPRAGGGINQRRGRAARGGGQTCRRSRAARVRACSPALRGMCGQ